MKMVTKILSLLFLPCCSFALGLNSYFQQGFDIYNYTNQAITVSDTNPATPDFQNVTIHPNYYSYVHYASDQFTNSSGQTFTRTVNIYSVPDNKLICTVTGNLVLGGDGSSKQSNTNSDKSKCASFNSVEMSNGSIYFGYLIEVKQV